ncbi:Tripartite motif containing 37 [Kappamyces sp. JEL0680]|nr:Tripartite motif containing 37 [Kappamyces sp. JEL0680]
MKVCCHSCLLRWLSEHDHCPHCRTHITNNSLKKAAFVEEIMNRVKITTYDCSLHQLSLSYRCLECNESFCSDCLLLDSMHKSHRYCRMDEAFTEAIQAISSRLGLVNQQVELFSEKVECINAEVKRLQTLAERYQSRNRQFGELVQSAKRLLVGSTKSRLVEKAGAVLYEMDLALDACASHDGPELPDPLFFGPDAAVDEDCLRDLRLTFEDTPIHSRSPSLT